MSTTSNEGRRGEPHGEARHAEELALTDAERVTATEALERITPRGDGLADHEVIRPFRIVPALAMRNVRNAKVALAPFRPRMAAAMPEIDLDRFDRLEETALAVVQATVNASRVGNDGEVLRRLEEARRLRRTLLAALHALALADLVPMKTYTDILAGSGSRDVAEDCVALPEAFYANAAIIDGKHPVSEAELAACAAAGAWLTLNLGTRGGRRLKRVVRQIDLRDRVATLLIRDYDDAGVLARYFLRESYDEAVRPLRSHHQPRRRRAVPEV
jgi:hypothetical protein